MFCSGRSVFCYVSIQINSFIFNSPLGFSDLNSTDIFLSAADLNCTCMNTQNLPYLLTVQQ